MNSPQFMFQTRANHSWDVRERWKSESGSISRKQSLMEITKFSLNHFASPYLTFGINGEKLYLRVSKLFSMFDLFPSLVLLSESHFCSHDSNDTNLNFYHLILIILFRHWYLCISDVFPPTLFFWGENIWKCFDRNKFVSKMARER